MIKSSNFFSLRIITLIFFIGIIGGSCGKDDLETGIGYVLNSGSYQSGGCEWIMEINLQLYKPRNLPVNMQIDSLPVSATFKVLRSEVDCPSQQGFSGTINLQRVEPI